MPASASKENNLLEMMARLGVDPAGGVVAHSGLTYLTALHRCQSCPSKQECRDWLDSMPMSMSFAPRFCPNGDLLFELEVDQGGHIRGPTTDLCAAGKKPDSTP
ncbi:MAG: DUF6455 family protein [Pseudolabrys sp.]|nr:DUF6455 family protein [Pseudolabrys sp.]